MARPKNESIPARLVASALALFVEKGFAATRLDDVAAHAGVSKGTVYLHFASKEDLFKAVIGENIVPVIAQCEATVAAHQGDSPSLLRKVLTGWWQEIGATQLAGVSKLMLAEARNFPELARYYHEHAILRGRRLIVGVLERGMGAGEFRHCDANMAFDIIISPLLMRAVWRCSMGSCCSADGGPFSGEGEPDATQRFLDLHFDLLVSGLLRDKT